MVAEDDTAETIEAPETETPKGEALDEAQQPSPAAGNGHHAAPDGAATGLAAQPKTAPPATHQPAIQFDASTYRFQLKKYGSVIVKVVRGGLASAPASVECLVGSGAAAAGLESNPLTVSFQAGETQKELQLPASVASLSEDGKSVTLTLARPQGAELGARSTAVVKLLETTGVADFLESPVLRRILKHALLVVSLLAVIYISSNIFLWYAEKNAKDWRAYLTPSDTQSLKFDDRFPGSDAERERLQDQLVRIRKRIGLHLMIMEYFYIRYFMAILTFSIAGALAAILLVMVSKRGWEQSNEYILTALFIATSATVFYGAMPGVFQQEQNIKENKVLYLKYSALENELLSFAATYEPAPKKKKEGAEAAMAAVSGPEKGAANSTSIPKDETPEQRAEREKAELQKALKDFIHYVDEELEEDNIAIGFDYSQVPTYKNAFDIQ